MKVKPMIFNTEMVRALLDGRKLQTRRPVKVSEGWELKDQKICRVIEPKKGHWGVMQRRAVFIDGRYEHEVIPAPAMPGDLIYVRETFYQRGRYSMPMWPDAEPEDAVFCGEKIVKFIGDDLPDNGRRAWEKIWRKRPSIHMPSWASRLTLKVTGVRVERVQDISEADAVKEGVFTDNPPHINWASADFSRIWHLTYPGSWERNDWVWVIDFEVIRQNVDEYLKAQDGKA